MKRRKKKTTMDGEEDQWSKTQNPAMDKEEEQRKTQWSKENPTISNGAKKNPATHAQSQRLWCQQVLIVPFVRECQSLI